MAGGRFTGTTNLSYIKPTLSWSYTYNDVYDTCYVTVTFYAEKTDPGYAYIEGNGNFQILIDDTWSSTYKDWVRITSGQGETKIFAFSHTVAMYGATTKSIKIQVTGGFTGGRSWVSTACGFYLTLDKNADKPPEPSTATVTPTVVADGANTCTVTIKKYISGTAYYKITWRLGNQRYTGQYGDIYSVSYTVPAAWASEISGTSAKAYVDLETYTDSWYTEKIEPTKTYEFTVTVPAGAVPTVQQGWASITPDNTGTNAPAGMYVQGFSKLKATFDGTKVTAPAGTTIKGYRLDYAGMGYGSPYITGVLNAAGQQSATAVVIDNRNRTASTNFTFTVESYANPTLGNPVAYRSNVSGSKNDYGTYVTVKAVANVSYLGGKNPYSLTAQIKEAGGQYGPAQGMQSGENLIISDKSKNTSYYVLITLTDTMGRSATSEILVPAAPPEQTGTEPDLRGFDIKDGGLGAAFGTAALQEGWLIIHYKEGLALTVGRKLKIGDTTLSEEELKALKQML